MSLNPKRNTRLEPADAPDLLQKFSPVRRSGSPLRRKQISELESGLKRPRLAGPENRGIVPGDALATGDIHLRKSPVEMARFDISTEGDDSALNRMADAVDRVANTFALTATSVRDMKLHQQQLFEELAEIRKSIQQLQREVTRLADSNCNCGEREP